MQKPRLSPHQRGWLVYKEATGKVVKLLFLQLLLRLISFSPLLYAVIGGSFFGFPKDHILAISFLFSLPLYVFVGMSSRFEAAAGMASLLGYNRESKPEIKHHLKWFSAALYRLLHALPFILPFMAFVVLFYYYMRVPGFNESMLAIGTVGSLVGGDYLAGIVIIILFGLLSALLAAWGWIRGVPFEHQPLIENGVRASWKAGLQIRRDRKKTIRHTIWINLLLSLPAVIGVVAVLGAHIATKMSGTLIFDFLSAAIILLTLSFPTAVLIQLLIVLVILWLPLLPLRKLALTAVLSLPPKSDKAQ